MNLRYFGFILCFNQLFVLYASNIVVIGAGSIKVTIQYTQIYGGIPRSIYCIFSQL